MALVLLVTLVVVVRHVIGWSSWMKARAGVVAGALQMMAWSERRVDKCGYRVSQKESEGFER